MPYLPIAERIQTDSRRNAFQFALADTVFKHVYPLIGYAALMKKRSAFTECQSQHFPQ